MKKIIGLSFILLSIFSFSNNVIRKISVTGNVEKEIFPDTAKITFVVKSKNENLEKANEENNKIIEQFKNDLKKENISIGDFETKSIQSSQNVEYNNPTTYKGDKKNSGKNDKIPSSYTVNIDFLVNNINFENIGEILEISGDDFLQSIKKNYDNSMHEFFIEENGKNLDEAIEKTTAKFNKIKEKLLKNGVKEKDILLENYEISEIYDSHKSEGKKVFTSTNKFVITTKNIKQLNNIIAIADKNGVNIAENIIFDISNKEDIEGQMYNEALEQAKTKAKSILKSSNMTLGNPLVISEDVEYQQKMIDRIEETSFRMAAVSASPKMYMAKATVNFDSAHLESASNKIDYSPKPIKLYQNISVLYEIK